MTDFEAAELPSENRRIVIQDKTIERRSSHAPDCVVLPAHLWVRLRPLFPALHRRVRAEQAGRGLHLCTQSVAGMDGDRLGDRAGLGAEAGCADRDSMSVFQRLLA